MQLDKKIKSIINKRTSLHLAKLHLVHLQKRLVEGYKEKQRLEKVLEKEYEDVLKLERLSIGQLFQRILGDKEEQMEIERQEYLQAVLVHKEWLKELKLMQYEKKLLTDQVKTLAAVEQEYSYLLELREQEIVTQSGKNKTLMRSYNKQIDGAIELKREIYEAKIVGVKIKKKLEKMVVLLENASDIDDWHSGIFIRKGGKALVQKAQIVFFKLKPLLFDFRTELEDIYKHRKIRLHDGVDKMEEMANMYYDNLISDWIVHRHIQNALTNIKLLQDRLVRTMQSLQVEEKRANQSITYLNSRKKALILDEIK